MHKRQNSSHLIPFILGGVVLYFLSGMVDELRVYQGATIAVYVVAISSIILLTGYSGQVSLGNGALTIKPGRFVVTLSEVPSLCATTSATSGIATRVTAPIMTPERVVTPDRTAPVSRENDRASGNALGETVPMVMASNAPAKPAKPALMVSALLIVTVLFVPNGPVEQHRARSPSNLADL